MLEGGHHVRRDQRPLIGGDIVQGIEADGMGEIGRIEVDHAVLRCARPASHRQRPRPGRRAGRAAQSHGRP